MPAVVLEPQLVDRASRAPEGDSWIHEIKYDGYRLLASMQRGKVWLYSRSGADWTTKLPWIAKAVSSLGIGDVLLDGELVYLDDDGFSISPDCAHAGYYLRRFLRGHVSLDERERFL